MNTKGLTSRREHDDEPQPLSLCNRHVAKILRKHIESVASFLGPVNPHDKVVIEPIAVNAVNEEVEEESE